jgi:hypothetical protein
MPLAPRLLHAAGRLAGIAALALLPVVAATAELVMVDRDGCAYCRAWKQQIGPAYPHTDLGRFAPLRLHNVRDGAIADVILARPVTFTPTFLLVQDGAELGRIEGYPGEDFFWGLLENLLREKTDFVGAS